MTLEQRAGIRWTEHEHGVFQISLANGRGNPLSDRLVASLEAVMDTLEARPPRALILDGGDRKLFSGGFDLTEILSFDEAQARRFFRRFFELLARIVELPCPTLAAIHGGAIAGGFILPLACDLRIVQGGDFKLGLTEVDLGVAVPPSAQVLLEAHTSRSTALRLSMFGSLLSPEEALAVGYADVLTDDARAEAHALAAALAEKPGAGVAATKHIGSRELAAACRVAETRHFDTFFDTWISDPAQTKLRSLADRLRDAPARQGTPPPPVPHL